MSSPSPTSRASRITNAYLQRLLKDRIRVPNFKGVFACDLLPRKIRDGESAILNTDPHDKPGKHYVAIYRKNGKTFYFDSLNLEPDIAFPQMHRSLERAKLTPLHRVLPGAIQALTSKFCGLFASDYILSRAFSDPKKINSYSLSNLEGNDGICLSNLEKRIAHQLKKEKKK